MIYAGIGNRKLPPHAAAAITTLAQRLRNAGFVLRSGGAPGADTAFFEGAGDGMVYRPQQATAKATYLAMCHHPAPGACNEHARRLHGRNAMIIMGPNLDEPVDFVLCYAVNEERGGTALGLRIARAHKIPTYNMARWPTEVLRWISKSS